MAVHLIPLLPSQPDYLFSVVLETTPYGMHVCWNDRDAAWYFDVLDAGGTIIQAGIKIVLGAYLGRAMRVSPFTDGVFIAVDTSRAGLDATFNDLGTRVLLYYVPALDLLAGMMIA
jgi:hypothetical protein